MKHTLTGTDEDEDVLIFLIHVVNIFAFHLLFFIKKKSMDVWSGVYLLCSVY